ncbi:LysM peptidoglycan-binding domain-containing protein [Apibacter raozihei]|uniref:LysM peptidoglycan-binding domain-containing protein n=1 Tax=Apibacter raozihei TaxID=2500547 RepID=UPI000FE2F7FD|nr:LysM peptidoglycan-binding domain-containing protein [Apibacter raozihei]
MPEYILHTVQKGDTLWGISKKYKVEEHKIVQANPEKIKLQKRGSKYTPVIYEGDVLRIPQDTEETVSYKIEGKASLGMGESTEYQLLDSEGNILHYPSEKISWQFHVDEGSENWRQLRLEKEKTGQKFTIVFTNQKLKAKKIRIEAYFKGQDSTQKLAEFLMALDGEDTAEIKKVELLDANRNLIKRKLSYAETLFARAQCTGMEGETLYFSLWEDDAPGAGHSKENEENFIATKQAQVVNGRAEVSFSLIYSTMAPIANRKIPAGQKDEGKYHEYYVTVTRYEGAEPEKSSGNVDVNNPDYVPLPPKPQPKKKETPKTQPQVQPKKKEVQETVVYGKSRTTNHAKITSIQITDILNQDINRDLSSGESVRIHINTQQCKGEKLRIDVYDNFVYANNKLRFNPSDLIGSNEILVQQDNFYFDFPLLRFVYNPGRDLWVVVTLYKTNQTVTTTTITVDKTDFSVPKPEGINPVTKQAPMQKKEEKDCVCQQYDLIWGNRVSCEFRKKVVDISKKLGLPQKDYEGANWLMAVMALETNRTFSPECGTFQKHKDNLRNGYVGLIQIGKDAAIDLGVLRTDLLKMTAEQQLIYVEKFYKQKRFSGKLKTKTDLYLAVNYPIACGQGTNKNYIVYAHPKSAYDDNPSFKREQHEFYIDSKGKKKYYTGKELKAKGLDASSYVWEFEEAINDLYNEGKKNKTQVFSCQTILQKAESNSIENKDDCVIVLTGEPDGIGLASAHRGKYLMYKVKIYNGIDYNTYLKYKQKNQLPEPIMTKLARDAWNKTKGRSTKRYGSKNETPPGLYWLTYYTNGIGSKGYKLKVSDTKSGDYIEGEHGKREGIRIHHYSPHFAEGCITTGSNEVSSVDLFIKKIPVLKSKSVRFIIEDRKAKYENNLYKGIE